MRLIIILSLFFIISGSIFGQDEARVADSTLVRIRVDVDSAKVYLENQLLNLDSYGSPLLKNSWFILNLPIDTYKIRIEAPGQIPIDTNIVLVKDEVYILDMDYIEDIEPDTSIVFPDRPEDLAAIKLTLNSIPDSSFISLTGDTGKYITPYQLYIKPGEYSFEADKEGFEKLRSKIIIEPHNDITATFNLAIAKPPLLTVDSLGLTYSTQLPLLNEIAAEKIKRKYFSLSESFAVFPLAQGILARLVVDESQYDKANVLIFSGVTLVVGTYVLGKYMYNKEKNYIIEENKARVLNNSMVEQTNSDIDKTIREKNAERLKEWLNANRDKGGVEIKKEPSDSLK